MRIRRFVTPLLVSGVFASGYLLGITRQTAEAAVATDPADGAPVGMRAQAARVFELRTYTTADGKHDALLTRFRDHTLRIFEKHGMTNVGYWTPQDAPLSENTLVYLLAHESRAAADASWQAFIADPEWQTVAEESQRDGQLLTGLERIFLDPTDFSPMR